MKKFFTGLALALAIACQNPVGAVTEPTSPKPQTPKKGYVSPSVKWSREVQPLSPIPENWEELHNAGYQPAPLPPPTEGSGGNNAKVESSRPDPTGEPILYTLTPDKDQVQVGGSIHFIAQVVGAFSKAAGPIAVFLNTGDLLERKVHPMYDDGQHNDGAAGDGLWGLSIAVPRDTVSKQATFYASATAGLKSIGIKKTTVTLTGGDFEIHNGFEGRDCRFDSPYPFPQDPGEADKVRGLSLKDGVWTIQGGWVGWEGGIEGQFGVFLNQSDGVIISPWLSGGSELWFYTQSLSLYSAIEVSISSDGTEWKPLDYRLRERGGNKGGYVGELTLPNDFHGYIRWRQMGTGEVLLDSIRLLKRMNPPPTLN